MPTATTMEPTTNQGFYHQANPLPTITSKPSQQTHPRYQEPRLPLRDSNRLRQMVANDFQQIQAAVGDMLIDRPRRNILRRQRSGGAA